MIGVTNVPGSELEKLADINLHIGAQADKLIAVQTYTGTVLALLLLAEEVLTGKSAQLSDACGAALPALSTHIEECLRASDDWQGLLMGAPLYLWAAALRSAPYTRASCCCTKLRRRRRWACLQDNFGTDLPRFFPASSAP